MSDVKFYDPSEVSLVVCGRPITSGFATDSKVKVTFDAPYFDDDAGVDGEVVRSANKDRRGTITVSLMQTSDANALLSGLLSSDGTVPGGAGVGTSTVKDNLGGTVLRSTASWVKGLPESAFDKKAGARTWEVRCAKITGQLGGNFGV